MDYKKKKKKEREKKKKKKKKKKEDTLLLNRFLVQSVINFAFESGENTIVSAAILC